MLTNFIALKYVHYTQKRYIDYNGDICYSLQVLTYDVNTEVSSLIM